MAVAVLFIIALSVFLDRITKLWAVNNLLEVGDIPVINNVFHLTYAENTGAAFSILRGKQTFFIIVTVIGLIAILWFYIKKPINHPMLSIALAFIAGGGIGNLIDRIKYGYVVDFLYIKIIRFPIFNLADIFVTTGSILLIWYVLFIYKDNLKSE